MKTVHVTYATKPERTEENARLVRAVFEELRSKAPNGLRYMVLRHGDGHFIHFMEQRDGGPKLSDFEAFRTFQKDANERFKEQPQTFEVQVVGAYGIEIDVA